MTITRINQFEAKAGRHADLRAFLQSVISVIRDSAGCRSVELLEGIEQGERLAIIEVWESVEAHQAAAKAIPQAKIEDGRGDGASRSTTQRRLFSLALTPARSARQLRLRPSRLAARVSPGTHSISRNTAARNRRPHSAA
jgi:quinol monooxygenase YgiN